MQQHPPPSALRRSSVSLCNQAFVLQVPDNRAHVARGEVGMLCQACARRKTLGINQAGNPHNIGLLHVLSAKDKNCTIAFTLTHSLTRPPPKPCCIARYLLPACAGTATTRGTHSAIFRPLQAAISNFRGRIIIVWMAKRIEETSKQDLAQHKQKQL